MLPEREGKKVWCHSSRVATATVIKNARDAQEIAHAAGLVRNVARQARNNSQLSTP